MKRFALAILVVMVVAASAFVVLNRPRAEASPDVTITVNSFLNIAGYRDGLLTLGEAMMLASGDLSLIHLGPAECVLVSGAVYLPLPYDFCYSSDPPGAESADTIVFDTAVFPPGNPSTIIVEGLLVLDTGNDTVDGSSAGVVMDGMHIGSDCFDITSNGNTIKGLEIHNCYYAVSIWSGARDNTIGGSGPGEGNVISGNTCGVIISDSGTDGNVVKGNYIGTNAAGDAALPNSTGVAIAVGAQNNIVGGTGAGEGNVISGNRSYGVVISGSGTDGNVVKGNYIGTNASGTAAVPNKFGVAIEHPAQGNTIGGSTAGHRNVISGNYSVGVRMSQGAQENTVEGNFIGTTSGGGAAVPNGRGIRISGGVHSNTIQGNVISGNTGDGVSIWGIGTNGNQVKDNRIGTDASGSASLPNGVRGVGIGDRAQGNIVGGTGPDEGNTIAFNGEDGVFVQEDALYNTIRGNSIHSNGLQGIVNTDGGNDELPPPTVTGFGSVIGTACPDCIVDIYSDDEDEGRVYEGPAIADGSGNWSFSGTHEGPNVTATATDSGGNTSEFSAPVPVPEPTPSPTPEGDSDGDTVPDDVEEAFGSDPDDPDSTPEALDFDPDTCTDGVDNDGDGLTDAEDEGCTVAPTRTLVWGPGWHNATWSGASTPEEAFACAAGNYAAAYRLVSGGWERHFPDRPEISTMTDLEQYDAFLILITEDVTCEMPAADAPGADRTLDWAVGWQNDGWTGADGMPPEDVFGCADGSYAAAYRLVGGGWERYFPDRPGISTMGPLDEYDAFLILVTAPVSCSMPIAP